MNVVEVPLDTIDPGDRLREIDEDYAQLIAASMRENGQRTPLEVRPPNRNGLHVLIAGAHRRRALEIIGADTAFVVVLQVTDLQARMLEIDENLCRHELTALDRATFLFERKRVWEELHPETRRGGDRRSDQRLNLEPLIEGFSAATADRLGLSLATIKRAVARHQRLPADVRSMIHATWIADSGSQLDALAKLAPSLQRAVANCIGNGATPGLRTVSAILRVVQRLPAPEPATAYERFLKLWRTADAHAREQIRTFLGQDASPPRTSP